MHQESADVSRPPVPWSGTEILVVLILVVVFWPSAVHTALDAAGVYRLLYGDDLASVARDPDAPPDLRRRAQNRLNLCSRAVAFPFQAATVVLLLYVVSGTRPAQLGLTSRRLGRNLLLGIAAAVMLTPAVLGLNFLVERAYAHVLQGPPQVHPLTEVAGEALRPAEWFLWAVGATVAAPVVEELLFRGMLQPWFASRTWGGYAAMGGAFVWSAASCWGRARDTLASGVGPFLDAAAPALFVLALVPILFVVIRRSRAPAGPALFGTAVLFAAVHSPVWPTPVALLLLALGLGGLAWWTRSLAGPMLTHSLFNACNCVLLLWR